VFAVIPGILLQQCCIRQSQVHTWAKNQPRAPQTRVHPYMRTIHRSSWKQPCSLDDSVCLSQEMAKRSSLACEDLRGQHITLEEHRRLLANREAELRSGLGQQAMADALEAQRLSAAAEADARAEATRKLREVRCPLCAACSVSSGIHWDQLSGSQKRENLQGIRSREQLKQWNGSRQNEVLWTTLCRL
jgi:hypothetical protein